MKRFLMQLSRLLFPPKCVLCGKLLRNAENDLCHPCRTDTTHYPSKNPKLPYLAKWIALWYYEGSVRKSLLLYKFRGRRHYAKTYGRLLAMKLLSEETGFDVLTWVPISTMRKWKRGYDQVALIAHALGDELGIAPVSTLKKVRNNRPQSRLKGAPQRRANVMGAYRCVHPEAIAGKRVLLLDDIITTGATAGECARVLLTAGAAEVVCAAVAAASHHSKISR